MDILHFLETLKTANCNYPVTTKPGMPINQLRQTEQLLNIKLPFDLIKFYHATNGLEGDDWIFNIIPFEETTKDIDYDGLCIEFAEYMIYSEVCGLEISNTDTNQYRFFTSRHAPGQPAPTNRTYIANSIVELIQIYITHGTFGIWKD
jgi:hypothetical protein